MTTLLKISKVRLRKRRVKDSPAREALPYHHKSIRIVVRQGLQQDGVDYAKDSSVGSNPERKRDKGDGRDSTPMEQGAARKPQVL